MLVRLYTNTFSFWTTTGRYQRHTRRQLFPRCHSVSSICPDVQSVLRKKMVHHVWLDRHGYRGNPTGFLQWK